MKKRYVIKYKPGPLGARNWRIWDHYNRKFMTGDYTQRQARIVAAHMNERAWVDE